MKCIAVSHTHFARFRINLASMNSMLNGIGSRILHLAAILSICGTPSISVSQTLREPKHDAGGVQAPTTKLERGRTVFVLNSCHFCHGTDLTQTAMGAANLMHSQIVAADVGGNIIGPIVKAGLPALQTSMPSYYEMTPQQISDLAAYVHYLRQMGKYKELMASSLPAGDVAAGKEYFNGSGGCSKCHSANSLASSAKDSPPRVFESKLLLPDFAKPKEGVEPNEAAQAHAKFTENASPADVSNLLALLTQ
jgi:mono/diheme cytochrome c family protein